MKTTNKNIWILAATLFAGLLLGWLIFGGSNTAQEPIEEVAAEETIWTCSMHPHIQLPEPGDCPICGMELIPLDASGSLGTPGTIEMSDYAMKLANIQTQRVGENSASRELSLNGKVAMDERAVYTQSTHIPGRIERLLVSFTGEEVKRGQALAVVYSPELITAQEELLQAYALRESQPRLLEAAKDKLRNWKIGQNQIERILQNNRAIDRFTITADVAGVVTEKLVELGDYVERGSPLYQIANLEDVWVLFDLYEQNISAVEEGDSISFTVASLPRENFEGTVKFIDPIIDRATRVATARVEVTNGEEKLKPGMFVSGTITNTTEETGSKLTVPKSAVLWTGKRSVVYVSEGTEGSPVFKLREVTLGPSLGESYVVLEGLEKGEEIVVNGTFTVDAAAQLAGKPSMMNPGEEIGPETVHGEQENLREFLSETGTTYNFKKAVSSEFQKELNNLLQFYFELKEALVKSSATEASAAYANLFTQVSDMEPEQLQGQARVFWEEKQRFLMKHSKLGIEEESLPQLRENFVYISQAIIKTAAAFGLEDKTAYVSHCPMANSDKGAYWLSREAEIRNPYYGEAMLSCGEVVKTLK